MIPETLQDIPLDLQTSWCVVPYPSNAQRCLLISAGGKTISRLEDGSVLHRFSSGLPNGSRGKREGSSDSWSIFDCFFHPDSSTYFVLDMMSWKGHSYYDCSTDFRFFFRDQKLAETATRKVTPTNAYPIVPLPYFQCTGSDISSAMSSPVVPSKDGLVFYNMEAHYELGPSPLMCILPLPLVVPTLQHLFQ